MEIICLQDGNSSTSAYCLPTVAGSVTSYFELARALGPGHLVLGIQCADKTPAGIFEQFSSLQDMAAAIAKDLLTQHRDGPICLIGYSFAAVLAIELARQLIEQGQPVPLVVMIDKTPPLASVTPLFRVKHFVRNVGAWALKRALKLATDPKHWLNYRKAAVRKVRGRHRFQDDSWYQGLSKDHQDYVTSNLANQRKYRFEGRYRGKILLLCQTPTAERSVNPLRLDDLEGFGWKRVTGAQVEVAHSPGDHTSMMQPPNVQHLANALRRALQECERDAGVAAPALVG